MNEFYTSTVSWLDDEQKKIETSKDQLSELFEEKYKINTIYNCFQNHYLFLAHFKQKKSELDWIFLDINLGLDDVDGFTVYEEIRKMDKDIIIMFISGTLKYDEIEEKVRDLRQHDSNLFDLPIPFIPNRDKDYEEVVEKPIEDFTRRFLTQLYERGVKEESIKIDLPRIYQKLSALGRNDAELFFIKYKHKKSVIFGKGINDIIYSGKNNTNSDFVTDVMDQEKSVVCAYNRVMLNNSQTIKSVIPATLKRNKRSISIQTIHAEILNIEEDGYVLLNCLLDEETHNFQIRKFDLAPFEEAVDLNKNKVITIEILTLKGERRFIFKNAKSGIEKIFERTDPFEGKDYSDILTPKYKNDEDNL